MKKRWQLTKFFRPYWPVFLLAFLMMATMAFFQGLSTALIKPIVDRILFVSTSPRVELLSLPFSGQRYRLYLDQLNPFPFENPLLVIGTLLITATLIKGIAEYLAV
jgi:ABC-type multidrug transport system fused ATPase/permease subunit